VTFVEIVLTSDLVSDAVLLERGEVEGFIYRSNVILNWGRLAGIRMPVCPA
jgi:hypothetical protein